MANKFQTWAQKLLGMGKTTLPGGNLTVNPGGISSVAATQGVGPDWAREIYGTYYPRSPLVYAALNLRAEAVARPKLKIYQQQANGDLTELPNHPAQRLLNKVNPWWTGADLWRATEIYAGLWGWAFWEVRDGGSPDANGLTLWALRPDQVRVVASKAKYVSHFIVTEGDRREERRIEPENMVWFRKFNPLDEFAGLSPMAPLRLSVDTANDAMAHNRRVFTNGIMTDTLVMLDGATDEQIKEADERINKKYAGVGKSHSPLFIAGAKSVEKLALTNRDMEFIAALRWSLEDVSRVYNVPKALLGDLERATFENIATAEQLFWRNCIVPELRFFEQEMQEMLITPRWGETIMARFDLNDIEALQDDENAVMENQRADVTAGILTINEVRNERGLPPVPWGDAAWMPATMTPHEDAEPPEPAPMAAPAPGAAGRSYKRWFPPEQNDAALLALVKAHGERLDTHAARFKTMQSGLFERQREDTLRRLRAVRGAGDVVIKQGVGDTLFDPDQWVSLFREMGIPLYSRAIVDAAMGQIIAFNLGFAFDVRNEITQRWLAQRSEFWAREVNDETARLLAQELQAAQQAGEGIPQIRERVEKVFRFNDALRAERIARTEIQSASNQGAVEAYRQSGVVEGKKWLAVLDGRERAAHGAAHGQIVPMEGKFDVGGEMLDHPGDFAGSAENVINCRCALAPVIRRGTRAAPPAGAQAVTYADLDNLMRRHVGTLETKLVAEFALLDDSRDNHKPKAA